MNKLHVYLIFMIAILAIIQSPDLRADGPPNSDVILDFEDLTDGTVYSEGEVFTTSIAQVAVAYLDESCGGRFTEPNNFVNVSATNFAGGSGIELGEIRNSILDFDFGVTIDSLQVLFYQDKRDLALYVNGEIVYFDHFNQIDDITIGGAAVSVTSNDPNQGHLQLTGTIYSFKIGGAGLWLDDMIVKPVSGTTYFVDVDGNDNNIGLNKANAFATIQKAINIARPHEIVAVYPGTYNQSFTFTGKPVTLKSVTDPPVLQAPSSIAVSFTAGDGKDTIMQNFIIENSNTAIFCLAGSPTIRNITVVGNEFGITAYDGSDPDIYNCIFWDNTNGDVSGCRVRYSCSQQLLPGLGNISSDPMFVQPAEIDDNSTPNDPNDDIYTRGDYHLKSAGWRWSDFEMHGSNWYFDDEGTSRCIDAGLPSFGLNAEPEAILLDPDNQWGANVRVNMGAYGGTPKASIPPYEHAFLADINNDGFVNGNDLLLMSSDWLESDSYLSADLSRDSSVNLADFYHISLDWGKMNEWARNISLTEYWPLRVDAKWKSKIVDEIGFVLEITDTFVVNGVKIWEFTNNYYTDEGPVQQVENRFYLDGVLYSVCDPNHLQTLPAVSANYKPLFKQNMVSGDSFQIEGCQELTPVRGSLASILNNSEMTVNDFPSGGNYDVIALFKDYRLPTECIMAIFGKGIGPLYIDSEFTDKCIIQEYISPD